MTTETGAGTDRGPGDRGTGDRRSAVHSRRAQDLGDQHQSATGDKPREISDPRTMRALAHPMRIALLEALSREGPLTATRAAELLDDSPGNMSWHLQTLAKYGFVEEAGGGRGRSRPWRRVDATYSFDTELGSAEQAAAGDALETSLMRRQNERLGTWWSQRRAYPEEWRRAAFSLHAMTYLTPEELEKLNDGLNELLRPFHARAHDKELRPPDSLPVNLVAFGHPLPPMPSGN